MNYKPTGICPSNIEFELVDGKVHNVKYTGGCNGNLQGVSALVEGMDARDVVKKLKGIKCGYKPTSCPDQLSKALEAAMSEANA